LRNPESRQDHTRREQPEAGLLTIYPQAVMAAVIELMIEERRATRGEIEISRQDGEYKSEPGSGDDLNVRPSSSSVIDARRS
jgi:hypothetical protein